MAKKSQGIVSRSLWLVILVPILGISAYSFYYVMRHLGIPPFIAWSASICYDGFALRAAYYSVQYAQEGMNASGPRFVVRCAVFLSAYIQTLHSQFDHEPPGAWVVWASLPVLAWTLYELHIRFEKRAGLARHGAAHKKPLPAFGMPTWFYFPISTVKVMRRVVGRRRDALERMIIELTPGLAIPPEPAGPTIVLEAEPAERPEPEPTVAQEQADIRHINEQRAMRPGNAAKAARRRKTVAIRQWAKANGHDIGDFGLISKSIEEAYDRAHGGG